MKKNQIVKQPCWSSKHKTLEDRWAIKAKQKARLIEQATKSCIEEDARISRSRR